MCSPTIIVSIVRSDILYPGQCNILVSDCKSPWLMSLLNNRIPITPIQSESPLSDAITIRDRRLLIRSNINFPSVVLKHSKLWFTPIWHQPQLQLIWLDNTADLHRLRTQIRWLGGSAEFYNHNILIKSAHKFFRIVFHQNAVLKAVPAHNTIILDLL